MAVLHSSVLLCLVVLGAGSACKPQGGKDAAAGESVQSLSAADQAGIRSADSAFMAAANAGDADQIA